MKFLQHEFLHFSLCSESCLFKQQEQNVNSWNDTFVSCGHGDISLLPYKSDIRTPSPGKHAELCVLMQCSARV